MPGLGLKRVQRPGFPPHWYSEVLSAVRADIAPDVQPTTSVATVIVAAPDSKDTTRADFVVPAGSTSAQTVINQAINSLPATGGKVVLLEGTYIVDGSIVLPSNVHLEISKGATVKLKDAFNANIYIITNADQTNGNTNIAVTGPGTIDGNRANQTAGVQHSILLVKVSNSCVKDLVVKNSRTHAIGLYNSSSNNSIISNKCLNINSYCISLDTSCNENVVMGNICQGGAGISLYSDCIRNVIAMNQCLGNTGTGIYLQGTNTNYNIITGNICKGNSGSGIYIVNSLANIVADNLCQQNNYYGIRLSAFSYGNVIGNQVLENSQVTDAAYDNIYLYNCDYCVVRNNICYRGNLANKPRYGINIAGTTVGANIIQGNDLIFAGATANLNNTATGTIIQNNRGYSTEFLKATGASVAIGTGGVYGAATAFTPTSGMIRGFDVNINIGGTFATGETVTVKIETAFSDGTTAFVEKSFTATGSLALGATDKIALVKGGVYITKINAYANSSAASTTVTCSVDVAAAT